MTTPDISRIVAEIPDLIIGILEQYKGFDSWWGDIDERDADVIMNDLRNQLEQAIAQQPNNAVPGGVEHRLFDSQWVNIVNSDAVKMAGSEDDAVAVAVKMTEQQMARNIADNKWPAARGHAAAAQEQPK